MGGASGVRRLGLLAAGVIGSVAGAGATVTTSGCELVCPPNCTGGVANRTLALCEEAEDAFNEAGFDCLGPEWTEMDLTCESYVTFQCAGIDDFFLCYAAAAEEWAATCVFPPMDCVVDGC